MDTSELDICIAEFDDAFYADEYPDVGGEPRERLRHFCRVGWFEGRNPSAYFDTLAYLQLHTDVARAHVNPLAHLVIHGRQERRRTSSAVSPSARAMLLFGYSLRDWVEALRPHVDVEYYLQQMDGQAADGYDPVAHFAFRGWREGKSPSPRWSLESLKLLHPQAVDLLVNPLLAQIEYEAGRYRPVREPSEADRTDSHHAQGIHPAHRQDPSSESPASAIGSDIDAERLALIRTELSPSYYHSQNPDIAAAGIDPVVHYYHTGWREGRNPNKDFDTAYYLRANEDVRLSGLNPFWHFLASGRKEGRRACRPGGYRRDIIERACPPDERTKAYTIPNDEPLPRGDLEGRIKAVVSRTAGLVVSLSHDCYTRVIGGTQIFIADEQRRFQDLGFAYVHLSPRRSMLTLAPGDTPFDAQVVLDGDCVGFRSIQDVLEILAGCQTNLVTPRLLVIHSLLGFHEEHILSLHAALHPSRAIFWLHDYASLCEGFNLLRNDLAFCHAPAPDSNACRVCVYGATRKEYLARLQRLFASCGFDVLSPSAFTVDFWKAHTRLPYHSATAHPHWHLAAASTPKPVPARKLRHARHDRPDRAQQASATDQPVCIGFVGFPSSSKGWDIFAALVEAFGADSRYQFFHFAARGTTTVADCTFVVTETTPDQRYATVTLLGEHRIDFLAMLAVWPETFSFVAHEAIAAGCRLLCLRDSGNVAALVRATGLGRVFDDVSALRSFLDGDAAVAAASEARRDPRRFRIVNDGTTATVGHLLESSGSS